MFDANFIANPYPTYQYLLANGRLHWIEYLGGAWLVPHYADGQAVLRDPRLSAARVDSYFQLYTPEQLAQLPTMQAVLPAWLVSLDGQMHLRLRRLLGKAFTPRTIEGLRPSVQRLTDELIDELIAGAEGSGEIELMHGFAHPLPAMVIAAMLGVPQADQNLFVAWSDELAVFIGSASPTFEEALRAEHSLAAMIDYFRGSVAERRAQPGDDLISLLIEVEEQGDVLDEAELLAQCALFLFAGHETTRNLIGNGLLALLQHPEQRALLERHPELIGDAVTEIARYDSPVQLVGRTATEDFEYAGQQIKRGQMLAVLPGAANRDPELFAEPDRFDITRTPNRPLSFGHGAHICIGKALAELEAEIAIQTLLRRLPNLQLIDATPDWSPNFLLRGLRSLPLRFDTSLSAIGLPETTVEIGGCPFHAAAR